MSSSSLCGDDGGSRYLLLPWPIVWFLFLSLTFCFWSKKFLDFFVVVVLSFSVVFFCVLMASGILHTRAFIYALLTSIVEVGVWFIPGIRFSPFDALFIGKGGKRPLVAMVTKGEVSGGGVGGRVGAESCPFVKYQNALLLETVF